MRHPSRGAKLPWLVSSPARGRGRRRSRRLAAADGLYSAPNRYPTPLSVVSCCARAGHPPVTGAPKSLSRRIWSEPIAPARNRRQSGRCGSHRAEPHGRHRQQNGQLCRVLNLVRGTGGFDLGNCPVSCPCSPLRKAQGRRGLPSGGLIRASGCYARRRVAQESSGGVLIF